MHRERRVRNVSGTRFVSATSGVRSETVRSANLATIVRELHLRGPASRSELVLRTGLTRSAIGALIGELVRAGLVVEHRAASDGSPGRPSPVAVADAEHNVAIAVDVAVDSLAVAAVGLGGAVLHVERVDRPRSRMSVDATIDDIVAMVGEIERRLSPDCRILGIGVGVVGLVNRTDNTVSIAPNLGWHDVAFGERLQVALGAPAAVVLSNDADIAALAEVRRGVAAGVADVLYVWGEVGVGGGLVSRGAPITGAAGFAGEVGHMPVNPDGRPCRCGSVGCWETEIGEGALLERSGRSPDGGRDGVDALLADAAAGVSSALDALAVEARWLGVGLAGLINVLNPSMVVLGGLLARIFPYIEADLHHEIERRGLASSRRGVTVVPSALGGDAPLLGAAELALEAVLVDPLDTLRKISTLR
jgi:predicted NBD/HSP70 family sugar kinase